MASASDYLFGLWKSYPFTIWTPLSQEQAAVQLGRSLREPWWKVPRLWQLDDINIAAGSFSFRHRIGASRQRPIIRGQIVNAPGGGNYVVGELAYGTGDKAAAAVSMITLTAVYGFCGLSNLLYFHASWSSAVFAAVPCVGVPTICVAVLVTTSIRTSRYHPRLRAHLCSALKGVDMTTQENLSQL